MKKQSLGISAMVLSLVMASAAYASAAGSMAGMAMPASQPAHASAEAVNAVEVTDEDSKLARGMTVALLERLAVTGDKAHKLSEAVERLGEKAKPMEDSLATLQGQLAKLKADPKASKASIDQVNKQVTLKQAQLNAARNSFKLEIKGLVGDAAVSVLGVLLFGETPMAMDSATGDAVKAAKEILATKAAIGHGPMMVLTHSLMDMMGGDSGMDHGMDHGKSGKTH